MAKGFLTTLDNAFDDSALMDIIPFGKSKPKTRPQAKSKAKTKDKPAPGRRTSTSKRKSFLNALEHALGDNKSSESVSSTQKSTQKPIPRSKRKSFLDTLEKAFDDPALDELIPIPVHANYSSKKKGDRKPQSRLSTSVDSKLLAKVREIAAEQDIRLKQIIEDALAAYLKEQ